VCYINIVVFLTVIPIHIGLLSSKIHNGDNTPKDRAKNLSAPLCIVIRVIQNTVHHVYLIPAVSRLSLDKLE